jgi:hypothetical protein
LRLAAHVVLAWELAEACMSERRSRGGARIGRRGALRAASAVGVGAVGIGALGPSTLGTSARALADATTSDAAPSGAAGPAWALPPRERVLAAHALRPLEGPARAALDACEAAGVVVVEAFAPRHGGLPFVVEIRDVHPDVGARRAFELVQADPEGPAPIAQVGTLALVLHNRGDGARASSEHDARLARRIAEALAPVATSLARLELATVRARAARAPFATLHVPTHPGDG